MRAFFCHVPGVVLSCRMAGLWGFGHGKHIFKIKGGLLDSGEGQTFVNLKPSVFCNMSHMLL